MPVTAGSAYSKGAGAARKTAGSSMRSGMRSQCFTQKSRRRICKILGGLWWTFSCSASKPHTAAHFLWMMMMMMMMMTMMMMMMCCGSVSGRMDVAVLRARVQMIPSRDWQDSEFYHRDF